MLTDPIMQILTNQGDDIVYTLKSIYQDVTIIVFVILLKSLIIKLSEPIFQQLCINHRFYVSKVLTKPDKSFTKDDVGQPDESVRQLIDGVDRVIA